MKSLIVFMLLVYVSLFGSETYNGNMYEFIDNYSTWDDANYNCNIRGMKLVTINDSDEQAFLLSKVQDDHYWIGYSDLSCEGYTWVSGQDSSYTNWSAGEPNGWCEDNCAMMYNTDGKWNDSTCWNYYYFICEKECGSIDMNNNGTGDLCDDTDNDGIADMNDNCPSVHNPNQLDTDNDSIGDVCDDDIDGDTVLNTADNCPDVSNENQLDTDSDTLGDDCDNCSLIPNLNQADMDNDEFGDACDDDIDGDEILNEDDTCPLLQNQYQQKDTDNDGLGDVCDNDIDGDTILNEDDNCRYNSNVNQEDTDEDLYGDVCDNCPSINNPEQDDNDSDKIGNVCDNCIDSMNNDQLNSDDDELGDECDNCAFITNVDQLDTDGDFIGDVCDNCLDVVNRNQFDKDGDLIGDKCDTDIDGDTILNENDNCITTANTNQADNDDDTVGDVCDNCSNATNSDQLNTDGGYYLESTFGTRDDNDEISLEGAYRMAFDSQNNIYITDINNNYIKKYDKNGNLLDIFEVETAAGIFIDENDIIYVTSFASGKVSKYDVNGNLLDSFMSGAEYVLSVKLTDTNMFLLTSYCEILKFDLNHQFISKFNTVGMYCFSMVLDSDENLYVSFSMEGKIYKYDQSGNLLGKFGKTGDVVPDKFEDGLIPKFIMNGIGIDANNNIYIPISNTSIVEIFTSEGVYVNKITNPLLTYPFNATIHNNEIYIINRSSESDIIQKYILGDNYGDICDNCSNISNNNQEDYDEDTIGDACDSNYCSSTQPFGQCSANKLCEEGVCVDVLYACSLNHTDGACEAGYECVEGVCSLIDTEHECSVEYPNGLCEEGKLCEEGICVDVLYACSLTHQDGACETGYECIQGVCVIIDTEHECSAQYTNGLCEEGKFCDNGVCTDIVYACSPAHTDGLCQSGYECKEGVCTKSDDTIYSGSSADGCSFIGFTKKSGEHTGSPLHGTTEGIMLFMMMIGLLIKRKSLKTK